MDINNGIQAPLEAHIHITLPKVGGVFLTREEAESLQSILTTILYKNFFYIPYTSGLSGAATSTEGSCLC